MPRICPEKASTDGGAEAICALEATVSPFAPFPKRRNGEKLDLKTIDDHTLLFSLPTHVAHACRRTSSHHGKRPGAGVRRCGQGGKRLHLPCLGSVALLHGLLSNGRFRQVEHLGRERRRCRTFKGAAGTAAVGADAVAVVTLLGLSGVYDAVAATGETAVEAAKRVLGVAVLAGAVALFAVVDGAVTAEGRHKAAIRTAAVGQGCVVGGRFTLFVEKGLHNAVAATSSLQKTVRAAAVEVACVSVVTFFARPEGAVTAHHARGEHVDGGSCCRRSRGKEHIKMASFELRGRPGGAQCGDVIASEGCGRLGR